MSASDPVIENVARWNGAADLLASSFPPERLQVEQYLAHDATILEIGAGDGRVLEYLSGRGFRSIRGLDPALAMVTRGKRARPGVHLEWLQDPHSEYGVPGSVDAVVLLGVLSSIPGLAYRQGVIERVLRVLSPKGRIVVGDFGRSTQPPYPARYALRAGESGSFVTAEGILIHHFEQEELHSLLSAFVIIHSSTVPVESIHGNALPGHVVIGQRRTDD